MSRWPVGTALLALAVYAWLVAARVGAPLGGEEAWALARLAERGVVPDLSGPFLGLGAPANWRPLTSVWLALLGAPDALALRLGGALLGGWAALAVLLLARRLGGANTSALLALVPALLAPLAGDLVSSPEGAASLLSTGLALGALLAATSARRAGGPLAGLLAVLSASAGAAGGWLLLSTAPLLRLAARRPGAEGGPRDAASRSGGWSRRAWVPTLVGALVLAGRLLARAGEPVAPAAPEWSFPGWLAAGLVVLAALPLVLAPLTALDSAQGWRLAGVAAVGLGQVLGTIATAEPLAGAFTGLGAPAVALHPAFLGAALAVGVSAGAGVRRGPPLVFGLALLAWAAETWHDGSERAAARDAERVLHWAHRARALEAQGSRAADELPLLDGSLPEARHGVWHGPAWWSATFAPPFAPPSGAAPSSAAGSEAASMPVREVWPRRVLVGEERRHVRRPDAGLLWPERVELRNVPELLLDGLERPVHVAGAAPTPPSARAWGHFPEKRFEAVLFTAHGYAVAPLVASTPTEAIGPTGGRMTVRTLDLGAALGPEGGLARAIELARAYGERGGYLEVRAVDDARGRTHRPVAASRWQPVAWEPIDWRPSGSAP